MLISLLSKAESRKPADILILPFWEKPTKPKACIPLKEFTDPLKCVLDHKDFQGKSGETVLVYLPKGGQETRCLLLGLGKEEKLSVDTLRCSYAAAVKLCQRKKWFSLNVFVPNTAELRELSVEECLRGITEGILLSNYKWDQKSNPNESTQLLKSVVLMGVLSKHLPLIKELESVAESVYFARDLVNGSADIITPSYLVESAQKIEKRFPQIKTTVFDKKRLEKEKMGLLLAVGKGSPHDPAFIMMSYKGNPSSKDHTVLIGKGITFDTGGLNLKPTGSMETMRDDMAGAACVFGTLTAVASLGLKVNVTAVVATAENAIGGKSYKPGDVYRGYSGKTVEVGNTDAEGRLTLADALSYTVKHLAPSRIVDIATLTGAIVVALGENISGMMSNDDQLSKQLLEASAKTNELLWRMPLHAPYKEALKSDIADIRSVGGRPGSSITAALFLEDFVENVPWAHIDIGGTAFGSKEKDYLPKNGSGVGIRLFVEFLKKFSK